MQCLMNDLFSMISYPAVVQVKAEIQKTIISGLKISPGRNSVFSAINAPSQFGELGGLNISEIELSAKDSDFVTKTRRWYMMIYNYTSLGFD